MRERETMATKPAPAPATGEITHWGSIAFDFAKGTYSRVAGSTNWTVGPIPWPGGPPGPPAVGQVLITLAKALKNPYTVMVSASRTPDCPMLAANYGDMTADNFVVILFDPVAQLSYRTVRNGNFSFMILQ
jgi:hypothetical protein